MVLQALWRNGDDMSDQVPSKDMSRQDALRLLGGWAMWSSPNEPDAELRAAVRAVLHDRLALIRQLEEMRVAAATAAFERAENEPKSDQCEVCRKLLPAVGAWSMPSCPDCQELLEGLGQLMGDFADREQTIKADWIGRAIDLICARPSQPPAPDDARDAARWRALVGCARVRVLGSAGLSKPSPTGYAHIGVEFWTHHEAPTDPAAIQALTAFVERATSTKGESHGG